MRAVIYARTSQEDQSEYSLDRQVDQGKKYAELRKWTVVGIYTEEHSARKGRREVFDSLFSRYWGDYDVLIVTRLDRGWRKLREMLNDLDRLKAAGKQFAATDQSIDTSSIYGWLVMVVIGAVAEVESATISERSKLGHRSSKERGYKTLRRLPKWFEVQEVDGKRFAQPSEEAYEVLKRIAAESIGDVARSMKMSSTTPLYRLQRNVERWKATGPWLLPPSKQVTFKSGGA